MQVERGDIAFSLPFTGEELMHENCQRIYTGSSKTTQTDSSAEKERNRTSATMAKIVDWSFIYASAKFQVGRTIRVHRKAEGINLFRKTTVKMNFGGKFITKVSKKLVLQGFFFEVSSININTGLYMFGPLFESFGKLGSGDLLWFIFNGM